MEKSLGVLELGSDGAAEPVTQETPETYVADGSSSASPLVVEDENRQTLMGYGPGMLRQIADMLAENLIHATSTDDDDDLNMGLFP